jgi:hypothetical protein
LFDEKFKNFGLHIFPFDLKIGTREHLNSRISI